MQIYQDYVPKSVFAVSFKDWQQEYSYMQSFFVSKRKQNLFAFSSLLVSNSVFWSIAFLIFRPSPINFWIPLALYELGIAAGISILAISKAYSNSLSISFLIGNIVIALICMYLSILVSRNPYFWVLMLLWLQISFFFVEKIGGSMYAVIPTLLAICVFQIASFHFRGQDSQAIVITSFGAWSAEIICYLSWRSAEKDARKLYVAERTSERLLKSILPESIAEELRISGRVRPTRIESASILFTDFVKFSQTTRGIDPVSIIAILNRYFEAFDTIAMQAHAERIKTIGDGYMCAAGIPISNKTHPIDICIAALAILQYVEEAKAQSSEPGWDIRIGINSGTVTAGVVGKVKFSYDIWGESVNLASRHESSGVVSGINVSKHTFLLTKGIFDFSDRGPIEIKGGEKMEMYELKGIKPAYRGEKSINKEFTQIYARVQSGELLLGYDI